MFENTYRLMKIVQIEKGILYSVHYDDEEWDEYNRIFEQYTDFAYVSRFFNEHYLQINNYYVKVTGIPREEREAYANKIVQETLDLEERFDNLIDNSIDGKLPDFHKEFKWLEGTEVSPVTGLKWGKIDSKSMMRIYAVEVECNCLIIVYGGIKIAHKLSECPLLDTAVDKVKNMIHFLKANNAITISGLEDLIIRKDND